MNKVRLLLLIFVIMSLSCTPRGCSLLPRASLAIVQYHLGKSVDEEGELTAEIVGVARNDGSAKLEYAEIKGKFYDNEGTLLYSGVTSVTNLDLGALWEFTISYSSAPKDVHPSLKILSYRLEKSSSEAKIVGQAQNDGDVIISFVQITGDFYQGETHPSLKILSCRVEKDGSSAKAVGEAQNDGDVTLSFAEITATFYDNAGDTLTTGTAGMVDLEVGETHNYTIFYPGSDYDNVDQATAKVTSTEYDEEETLLASSTASTTNLEVGGTWDFSILYPKEDYEKVDHVTAEVKDGSLDYPEETYDEGGAEQVSRVTAQVGTLRGSSVMP